MRGNRLNWILSTLGLLCIVFSFSFLFTTTAYAGCQVTVSCTGGSTGCNCAGGGNCSKSGLCYTCTCNEPEGSSAGCCDGELN